MVPGETRTLADGRTRTEIWSMPESVICRAGHEATYALMGGWWEICSVRYAIRSVPLPAVDMDVGGEGVVDPEPDSPVWDEARERLESWAEAFDSTTVDVLLSTVGEDQPFIDSRLPNALTRPDLSEPLTVIVPVPAPVSR